MDPYDLLEDDVPPMDLPEINARDGNLAAVAEQAWHAIQLANRPPKYFTFGDAPVRLIEDGDGNPATQILDVDRVRYLLARVARWYEVKRKKTLDAPPPTLVVRDLLASPNPPLPRLRRVVRVPVLTCAGSIHTEPGYDPLGCLYYWPRRGFAVPAISSCPSRQEVDDAVRLLRVELLGDFPFATESDQCHAMAMLFQPFLRDLIAGPTPLYFIEKPSPGTGATLLGDVLTHPALGAPLSSMSEGRDEDEWRKRLTAKLLTLPGAILIDNVRRRLDSGVLSLALTATTWEDRLLGFSRMVALPVRCTWLATGNNPGVSNEISRRMVRIRMDARVDRPWLRTGFRHPLPAWGIEKRPEIVAAILTILAGWIAAGRPMASSGPVLGMYESWSQIQRGCLEFAGISGFLGNIEETYETSDVEGTAWRRLVETWWEVHGTAEVGVTELYPLVSNHDLLDLGHGNERSQRTRLGHMLCRVRDRQFGQLRLTTCPSQKRAQRWKLVNVEEGSHEAQHEVHQAETQADEHLNGGRLQSGEPGEPISNPSACARARASDVGSAKVHQVHQVYPPPIDPEEIVL